MASFRWWLYTAPPVLLCLVIVLWALLSLTDPAVRFAFLSSSRASLTASSSPLQLSWPLGLPSSSSSSPTQSDLSFSPLLRSPVSHHGYAALFEKLSAGVPVRVAVIGGSISESRGWFLRNHPELGYFHLLVQHLNAQYPVTPPTNLTSPSTVALLHRLTAFDSLMDSRDRTPSPWAHKVANFAAGGTGTQSSSFCWSSLFTVKGELHMPDLILIDYAVNDAYMLAGSMVEDSAEAESGLAVFPMSPLHSLERLLRSVFLGSRSLQQPTAVLLLYFASSSARQHKSVQAMQDRVARHYGVAAVRWRDHLLHPAVRRPFPVQQPVDVNDQGVYFDGDESIHPNPQGHYLMGQLLIRQLTQLYDNFDYSQRSSLADPWLLSGHIASTSARLKDRPTALTQAADDVMEVCPEQFDSAWRVHSDVEAEAVDGWQEAVMRGEEVEPILPPLLALPPLPLPPALHPLNQELPPYFLCRKTYQVYIGDVQYQPFDVVERWFGMHHSTARYLSERPLQPNNASADFQWLFAGSAKAPAKLAFSPHPDYMAAYDAQQQQQSQGDSHSLLPLPSMTVSIPRVHHSASLFYLRTWQPMATAAVHLFCSSSPEVKTPTVILNGTWASPTSQATATCVYANPRLLKGATADEGPTCFDRLHLQIQHPGEFRIVGYAVA